MKKFLLLILPLLIFSCSNEISELVQTPKGDYEVYNFEYNGEQYSVKYYYAADSTVVFEDPAMKEFIEKIDEEPELMTLVNEDGTLSFYQNYETFLMVKEMNSSSENEPAARQLEAYKFEIRLYADNNYYGRCLSFNSHNSVQERLEYFKFNDQISSIQIENNESNLTFVVTFYEKDKFKGKSLSFTVLPKKTTLVPALSSYKLSSGFLGIGKKSWNNQISSFKTR